MNEKQRKRLNNYNNCLERQDYRCKWCSNTTQLITKGKLKDVKKAEFVRLHIDKYNRNECILVCRDCHLKRLNKINE